MVGVPIEELHKAVYERLSQDLAAEDISVYDEVPEDAEAPYVVLMDQKHRGPTSKGGGWEGSFEVNIWSTYRGTKEVAHVINLVVASMDREDYVVGAQRVVGLGFETVEATKAARGGVPGMLGVVRQRLKVLP